MTDPSPQRPNPAEMEPIEITADVLHVERRETRVDFERGMSYLPWLSVLLIVINIVVFAWQVFALFTRKASFIDEGALVRAEVLKGEIWRLVTCCFLHASVAHLLGNCLMLYILGLALEHGIGIVQTAIVYAVAGLCGSVLSMTLSPGPSVGASGAVFGMAGATVVFLFRYRNMFYVRDKQIGYVLLGWSALQVAGGFFSPHIDNWAHVGGLVGGALAVIPMRPTLAGDPGGFELK